METKQCIKLFLTFFRSILNSLFWLQRRNRVEQESNFWKAIDTLTHKKKGVGRNHYYIPFYQSRILVSEHAGKLLISKRVSSTQLTEAKGDS